MQLPVLYKSTDNNKIKFWKIVVEEISPEKAKYYTEYGLIGGKITITEPQFVEGKVGSKTAFERALQLVKTKWNNKKTTDGYAEEQRNNYVSFLPMKPLDWEKFSDAINYPAYLQPKLDGVRMFAYLNKNGELQTLSRQNKPIENIEPIREQLKNLFAKHPDIVLDGELLISKEYEQKDLRGVLSKKFLDSENKKKIDSITYNIFDTIERKNMNAPFSERWNLAEKLAKDKIKVVPTLIVKTKNEVNKNFNELVEKGFEGAIIRNSSGIYRMGKASKDVQKIKLYFMDEFEIIDYHEGTGSDKGTVIWEVKCLKNPGRSFRVKPMGSRELKKKWFEDGNKYIGKKMLVYFYEKNAEGCVMRIKTGEMK